MGIRYMLQINWHQGGHPTVK